jgi:diadenosine tetraphosphate (Ap4A) HIT family hydrolase
MFNLDERLCTDTAEVGDLPLCRMLLMKDAHYPWIILVPRKNGLSEVFDLSAQEQQQLIQEISLVAERLKSFTTASKMNVATLGNVVKQLHIHVVARFEADAAWPGPVWGRGPAKPYSDDELENRIDGLKSLFVDNWKGGGHDA